MSQGITRRLKQEEAPALDELTSLCFGYGEDHHYFGDFPFWATEEGIRLGRFETLTAGISVLVAHVGLRMVNLKTGSGFTPVGMIGAVATHPSFRGKGYSKALMQKALETAESGGAEWAILWGSEFEFYGKLGFDFAGKQYQALLSEHSEFSKEGVSLTFPKIVEGFDSRIFEHELLKSIGVQLNPRDVSWYSRHESVKWFHTVEGPFAYCGIGRGMDLPDTVHEWGGDPTTLKKLLTFIYQEKEALSILGTKDSLMTLGYEENFLFEEHLCLAKPLGLPRQWNPDFWISGLGAV